LHKDSRLVCRTYPYPYSYPNPNSNPNFNPNSNPNTLNSQKKDQEVIQLFINEDIDYKIALNTYKKGGRYELHELKSMLKEIMKGKTKRKAETERQNKKNNTLPPNIPATSNNDSKGQKQQNEDISNDSQDSAVMAIFADVLLKVKTNPNSNPMLKVKTQHSIN
jgi:hypothetical protein